MSANTFCVMQTALIISAVLPTFFTRIVALPHDGRCDAAHKTTLNYLRRKRDRLKFSKLTKAITIAEDKEVDES